MVKRKISRFNYTEPSETETQSENETQSYTPSDDVTQSEEDTPGVDEFYERTISILKAIDTGEFFQYSNNMYKRDVTRKIHDNLSSLRSFHMNRVPSIQTIINDDKLDDIEKYNLMLKIYSLSVCDPGSCEYNKILEYFDKRSEKSTIDIIKTLNTSESNKNVIMDRYKNMSSFNEGDSDYSKYKTWIDNVFKIPFGKYSTKTTGQASIKNFKDVLDKHVSFLELPKDQIVNLYAKMLRNPDAKMASIGLYGTKGTGKCLAKNTRVLMYSGELKKVQMIQVGDLLMGDDSSPRIVTSTVTGHQALYRVTHTNTLSSYTVNQDHILTLYNVKNKECIDISLMEYVNLSKRQRKCLKGYTRTTRFDLYSTKHAKEFYYNLGVKSLVVPRYVKTESVYNRLYYISGVVNTIGKFNSKRTACIIKNSHPDLYFVISSLGIHCKYIDDTIVMFGQNLKIIPSSCTRHINDSLVDVKALSSITIERVPGSEYHGFELYGRNNRFVLENFIRTHNTSIVKSISEAFNRPYRILSLGGESDASCLTGHHFTYIGAIYGRIIDILIQTECMDPIILIDEIDKISDTPSGREIVANLIHLTDATTNSMYNNDRYFSGIQFDLSKILFVFTYNDEERIDKILLDRIFKIRIEDYTIEQKIVILRKHIIPKILSEYSLSQKEIVFSEQVMKYIANREQSTGMRWYEQTIDIIVSRINTLILTNGLSGIINLEYFKLYDKCKNIPFELDVEDVKVLLKETRIKEKTVVHGMYI